MPRRKGQDNVIFAQEIFHSMCSKSDQKGWMSIKIDLEKTYDSIRWLFNREILEDIRSPHHIVSLIWFCISTSRMRLLWNGEALEMFKSTKDIRQGDPLSPYLFVLCLERLFRLVDRAVSSHSWRPIKVSRGWPKIYHHAFADDLILFAEASVHQATVIQQVLYRFCVSSRQKVNHEKTQVFFSKKFHWDRRKEISRTLGFSSTDDLGKYLGIPILHKRVTKSNFQFVVDKVKQRLSAWKARNLSLAGRVPLAKSFI